MIRPLRRLLGHARGCQRPRGGQHCIQGFEISTLGLCKASGVGIRAYRFKDLGLPVWGWSVGVQGFEISTSMIEHLSQSHVLLKAMTFLTRKHDTQTCITSFKQGSVICTLPQWTWNPEQDPATSPLLIGYMEVSKNGVPRSEISSCCWAV